MRPRPLHVLAIATTLALSTPTPQASDARWADSARLLEAGPAGGVENSAAAALERLLKDEELHAGEPDYDLLLARAYHVNGQWRRALFALERVLISAPERSEARLMAAAIHTESGEWRWAERALARLDARRLSAEQRREMARIETLLGERLEEQRRQTQPSAKRYPLQLRGSLAAGLGHDANVTFGPADETLWIPAFAGLTTLVDGAEEEDDFSLTEGRLSLRYGADADTTLSAAAHLSHKRHQRRGDLDEAYANLRLGLARRVGHDWIGLTALRQSYRVDGDPYRRYWGVLADWKRPLEGGAWLGGYLHHVTFSYPDNATYDAARGAVGLYRWQPFRYDDRPGTLRYGLHAGTLEPSETGSAHLGYRLWGGRLDLTYRPLSALTLGAGLSLEARHHDADDPYYLATREERQWNATLSAAYALNDAWSLIAKASHTRNDANLALYDYDRTLFTVSLNWEFDHAAP